MLYILSFRQPCYAVRVKIHHFANQLDSPAARGYLDTLYERLVNHNAIMVTSLRNIKDK